MLSKLQTKIAAYLEQIPVDAGGGCSPSKAYLLAWLIRQYALRSTLDIGVYRGRSFFPQALAHSWFTGGTVYGVDPWCADEARQHDMPALQELFDQIAYGTDFQAICEQVAYLRRQWQLEEYCVMLRQTSATAADYFRAQDISFDLIHIDGNHDTRTVMNDVELYLTRLNKNGFIVLDDISWESVRPAYQAVAARLALVYEQIDGAGVTKDNDYAVFWNGDSLLGVNTLRLLLRYVGGSA